jgi:soluble lytic murein transglycosylase-like protein
MAGFLMASFLMATFIVGATSAHAEQTAFVLTIDDLISTAADAEVTPQRQDVARTQAPTLQSMGICAFADRLHAAAARHGLPPDLLVAVAQAETRCRHAGQRSPKGAIGLMQLMPATARRFGAADPWDLDQNIAAAAAYLAWLSDRYEGDVSRIAAAYNAGEGAVDTHGGIPPYRETQAYVRRVRTSLGLGANAASASARARLEPSFVFDVPPPEAEATSDVAEFSDASE